MSSNEQSSDSAVIFVRMDNEGHCYQTDLKLHIGTAPRQRNTLARKAKWIQIAGEPGNRQIWEVSCPFLWYLQTYTKLTMGREEYKRLEKKLIWGELQEPERCSENGWLCLGDRFQTDFRRACEILGWDWKKIDLEQFRAKLLELATGDEAKLKKYGSGPDEVMVSRAWLVKLAANLARKRRKKKV